MGFFRQEDEMDKYIALKSLKISYWFTVLFLLVWAYYRPCKRKSI